MTLLRSLFAAFAFASAALLPALADEAAGLGKAKGRADAPVTIIEYMSPTCGACKHFHEVLEPVLVENYIKTGKVRLEVREFLRNEIDLAISAMARCSGKDDTWFAVMSDAFAQQKEIAAAAQAGTLEDKLVSLGTPHGIKTKEALNACLKDPSIRFDLATISKSVAALDIVSTPTLIVNGKAKTLDDDMKTKDGFKAWLDTVVATKTVTKPAKPDPRP